MPDETNLVRPGVGAERDRFRALERRAREGEPRAQRALALCLLEGRGAVADRDTALAWLRRAAESGDEVSQERLAGLLMARTDNIGLFREGLEWARRAARQGSIEAMHLCSGCLTHGLPHEVGGLSPWGEVFIGGSYAGGADPELLEPGAAAVQTVSPRQYWLHRAARRGDAAAMAQLAWLLADMGARFPGNGSEPDESDLFLAEHWARKSSEAGSADGAFVLGRILALRKRLAEAYECFSTASDRGSMEGAACAARLLRTGAVRLEADPEAAALHAQRAIDLYHAIDWSRKLIVDPIGKDPDNAHDAQDELLKISFFVLGRVLADRPEPGDSLHWLEEAGSRGFREAVAFLACSAHDRPRLGLSAAKALDWCNRAVSLQPPIAPAFAALARHHRLGDEVGGGTPDPDKAAERYAEFNRIVLESGTYELENQVWDDFETEEGRFDTLREAWRESGRLALFGTPSRAPDPATAERYFTLGAACGDLPSWIWARHLAARRGHPYPAASAPDGRPPSFTPMPADPDERRRLLEPPPEPERKREPVVLEPLAELEERARSGDLDALNRLGVRRMHPDSSVTVRRGLLRSADALTGFGGDSDWDAATDCFRRAAERGHGIAARNLAWCLDHAAPSDEDEERRAGRMAEEESWYRRSAEAGCALGQFELAEFLESSSFERKPRLEILYWLQAAAWNGHADAWFKLARAGSETGLLPPWICAMMLREALVRGCRLGRKDLRELADGFETDSHVSIVYWRERAEAGDRYALDLLAHSGRHDLVSEEERTKWLERLAEGQYANRAKRELAIRYRTGTGTARAPERAARLFGEAAEKDVVARYERARCLLFGDGVDPDRDEAIRLFRESAMHPFAPAWLRAFDPEFRDPGEYVHAW